MSGLGTVLTAIVTPFAADGSVNEDAFVALLHHLAENGSDGFVVAGTTGEASTLTDVEQLGLIELAVAERPSGKTIIAGTGTNDTRQVVHLTERATELGADAMQVRLGHEAGGEKRALGHQVIAVLVIGRDVALVAEKELRFIPGKFAKSRLAREQGVKFLRRGAAGKREGEDAAGGNAFAREIQ